MREKNTLSETKNCFWVYSFSRKKWSKVYENENCTSEYWAKMENKEPRPRFAHQLVYDPTRRCQYMFGGNPGEASQPNLRLNDFWELYLTRPSPKDILRKAQFQIRKQKFIELSNSDDKTVALQYLQTKVSHAVNHDDAGESQTFRELAMHLFSWNHKPKSPVENLNIGGMAVDPALKTGKL
jgi:muskelin